MKIDKLKNIGFAVNSSIFLNKFINKKIILSNKVKKKYHIHIDIKNNDHLNLIKKSSKYQKYLLKENYMQKVILRNQILILIDKTYTIKDIIKGKLLLNEKCEKYYNFIKNELILFIQFFYSIIKFIFKDSVHKINEVVFKKSPITDEIPLDFKFDSKVNGIRMLINTFLKVFDYFRDCSVAFFLLCNKVKDQLFSNIEIDFTISILEYSRYKLSKFIEFYKITIKPLTSCIDLNIKYKTERNNKYGINLTKKSKGIQFESTINLNKETKRGIMNFSNSFKIKSIKSKMYKPKDKLDLKKENEKLEKMNYDLKDLLNYINSNKIKNIPKHYKKYIDQKY